MTRASLELVVVFHKHLTRDIPDWMMRLWGLRFASLIVLALVVASVPTLWGLVLMASFVAVALAGRSVLRHKGVLSTPNRTEPNIAGHSRSERHARLICYGDPVELDQLRELRAEFFEPLIVQYFPTARSRIEWLMIVCGLVALVLSTRYLAFGVLPTALVTAGAIVISSMGLYLASGYYRVVPGRLDTLSCGLFRRRLNTCNSTSLKRASIVCRYGKRTLEITPPGAGGVHESNGRVEDRGRSTLKIDLSTLPQPHTFCEAVFRAALCERVAPLLPRDELLG